MQYEEVMVIPRPFHLKVSDLMTTSLVTVKPGNALSHADAEMRELRVHDVVSVYPAPHQLSEGRVHVAVVEPAREQDIVRRLVVDDGRGPAGVASSVRPRSATARKWTAST